MIEVTSKYTPEFLQEALGAAKERVAKKDATFKYLKLANISTQVFEGGNYTAVLLEIIPKEDVNSRFVMGVAKRNPTDPFKPQVGLHVAMHRAVRAIKE